MAFTAICKLNYITEGEWVPATAEGEAIMLVWPDGDRIHAFAGMCPHEQVPLGNGIFNGRIMTCTAHGWVFDGRTGRSLSPTGCTLEEYPVRIEDGWVRVDMESVLEARAPDPAGCDGARIDTR